MPSSTPTTTFATTAADRAWINRPQVAGRSSRRAGAYADNSRAVGLYEKHGFVREGLRRDCACRDAAIVDASAMARMPRG